MTDINKQEEATESMKLVELSQQDMEIIRDLICDYRDGLAGTKDGVFDKMQSLLEKLR